jgi:hypothetical protein
MWGIYRERLVRQDGGGWAELAPPPAPPPGGSGHAHQSD